MTMHILERSVDLAFSIIRDDSDYPEALVSAANQLAEDYKSLQRRPTAVRAHLAHKAAVAFVELYHSVLGIQLDALLKCRSHLVTTWLIGSLGQSNGGPYDSRRK